MEYFEKMSDVDVLHPRLCAIDKDGNYIKGEDECFYRIPNRTSEENIYIAFMNGNILQSPGMAMRRKVIETIFPLSCSFVNFQDYAIHIDVLINGFKSYVLDEILVDYRIFDDGKNISLNNNTAIAREQMEIAPLMDYFLKIKDIELLKRVFKDEIQKHNIEPYEDTIPFFLGQMALLSPHYKRQEWGYHTIMNFLRDKKNFDRAYTRYNFIFKDYFNVVNEIKNEEQVHQQMQIKIQMKHKKYKKYKKLFNMSLLINIVLLLMICLLFF